VTGANASAYVNEATVREALEAVTYRTVSVAGVFFAVELLCAVERKRWRTAGWPRPDAGANLQNVSDVVRGPGWSPARTQFLG
jgi:hypothetical protein